VNIKHLQKTTLIDYPGLIASIIFVGGCNYNCAYCYNVDLKPISSDIDEKYNEEVFQQIKERSKYTEGVVITGGEPTVQLGLIDFLKKLRTIKNFKIKLDTNGYEPDVLKNILASNLVDYVAMDLKSALEDYEEVVNTNIDTNKIVESINLLKSSGIEFEFRTTLWENHPIIQYPEKIFHLIESGTFKYYLQNYFATEHTNEYSSVSKERILPIYNRIKEKHQDTYLRGDWN